jgi:DNA-binding MarR family transcriptional regulator
MNFTDTMPFLLAQIATAFKVELEKSMDEISLHGGQVFVLFELWKTDGLSQIDVAQALRVSPPTVNKMVRSLSEGGFVECRKCPGDGRLMRLFLTKKGLEIRPEVERQWASVEQKLLANLTETEKLVLFQLFGKVRDNLLPPR